jgi:hypothetical protein
MRCRFGTLLVLAGVCGVLAFAQTTSATFYSPDHYTGTATFSGPPPFAAQPVTGAAYSGEEVTEQVQILANGTHITRTVPGRKIYRDSEGRTRVEHALFRDQMLPQTADSPVVVEITDPVAGYQYTLDTQNHVAHRLALPPAGPRPAPPPSPARAAGQAVAAAAVVASTGTVLPPPSIALRAPRGALEPDDPMRPSIQSEQLGNQMFDGVQCDGTRTTTTFPVGSLGNDQPIVTTHETWISPELRLTVMSKNSDPRSGENTFRIKNLSRLEPDPSLFQVPPDFTVVDEKGPFTITYTK